MKSYASFFEWPDRQRAELGVVEELIVTLRERSERRLLAPEIFRPDPPDCVCINEQGKTVAVEITEVVCSDAARLNAQGRDVFRYWRPGELHEHLSQQIEKKDKKQFHGGPYSEVMVCLFTDEPSLTIDRLGRDLAGAVFGPYVQVTAAYIVMSYDPSTRTYPVHTLKIENAA